jgi:rsbT co-antagonist protein RsbR
METNFYKQIIENAPFGFVHYKAVRDTAGLITDYVFIEGNKVFESFTGRLSADSVGESIPNILMAWDLGGDWIDSFQKIGLISSGEISNLSFFIKSLNRWYSVQASTLSPDHYTVIFTDISQSKKNEAALYKANKRVEKQRAATAQLLLFNPAADLGELTIEEYRASFIAPLLADALSSKRASLWLFDEALTEATCVALYDASTNSSSKGTVIYRKDFPNYFEAICTDTRINASNAQTDSRTSEFAEIYLKPLNIGAMLDAAILVEGKVIGLICVEHIGGVREWNVDEEAFISTAATIYAQMSITKKQREAEEALLQSQLTLQTLAQQQEADRALQLQQGQLLLDISTPITQLWKNILLLPLVGGMSQQRSQKILSTVLKQISKTQAKVFILDISGVSLVDTAVANSFIKLAKATQLMGCACIVSGVSPAVAQTIVELGIMTNDLQTTSQMQDALVVALRLTGMYVANQN